MVNQDKIIRIIGKVQEKAQKSKKTVAAINELQKFEEAYLKKDTAAAAKSLSKVSVIAKEESIQAKKTGFAYYLDNLKDEYIEFTSNLQKKYRIISTIIIAVGIIFVWRGVWVLTDIFLLPENYTLSAIVSILIGLGILYFRNFNLSELREH